MRVRPSLIAGFTVLELLIVLVIIGTLTGFGITSWRIRIESEYANIAKTNLTLICLAEQRFYAWKGRYSDDWDALGIEDPSSEDIRYDYGVLDVAPNEFTVRATREGTTSGFEVDKSGTITEF